MNCQAAHELLQQSLDGTPIESPEWLEHLRDCAECRALASAGRRLQGALHLLTAPPPPPDLAARIAQSVLADRRRIRRRTRRRWAASLALAAALLIALLTRLDWRGRPAESDSQPREPVANNREIHRRNSGPTEPTLGESARELGDVFAALTNQTADETVGQTRRWVANVSGPELPTVDLTTMQAPAQPLRQAGAGVSEGLEPVTTSARRAVGLFLRELPMETEPNGL
jgi:hypothetical protein